MKFLKNWKNRKAHAHLEKLLKARQIERVPVDFEEAKFVGILLDAGNKSQKDTLQILQERLQQAGITVSILGYLDQKEPHANLFFKHLSKKDLNWFGFPKMSSIANFIDKRFDFLINLDPHAQVVLEYISSLSHAHFRVGRPSSNLYAYDMMIETEDPTDINLFVSQMTHYLDHLKDDRA